MKSEAIKTYLTVSQFATKLGTPRDNIYRAIRAGKIKASSDNARVLRICWEDHCGFSFLIYAKRKTNGETNGNIDQVPNNTRTKLLQSNG